MSNVGYVYGVHPVLTLLKKSYIDVLQICVDHERKDQQRLAEIISVANANKVAIQTSNKAELKKLVGDVSHQGVVANCEFPGQKSEKDLIELLEKKNDKTALILVLDQVQDPHNLGACLRSADACGVDCVIAPKDRSASLTASVFKVSSGAALTVPYIQVTNLARTLRLLREYGVQIVGTSDGSSDNLFNTDMTQATALVLGAEAKGMRRLTTEECDHLVHLPMSGVVESLNVSVAAGVCLYEVIRQRASFTKINN